MIHFLFSHLWMFFVFGMAASASTLPGAGGEGAGGAGQQAPAGGQQAPAGGQQQQQDGGGIAQLRTAYESIKKEFEPYQKLNLKPEQISQYSTVYQKTFEEVASIGRQLGYPDDEILEALQENPVATLDYLRNEFQQAQAGQQRQDTGADLNDLVAQRVEEAVAPISEWQNTQMTSQANALFERTAYQMAADLYKQEGLDVAQVPQDEIEMLLSATSEILKYDDNALKALKYEGKTAAIQKAFTEAKTMLDKYYVARSGRSNGQARGQQQARPGQQQQQAAGGKKPTLDDLINSPELINPKYKEA